MMRVLSVLLGIAFVVLLIVGPVAYAVHDRQHNLRNFRVVHEGVLYRVSQPSESGLKRLVHDYGIRTVISLRDAKGPGLPVPDQWEEKYCDAEEINFVRLSPQHWESGDEHAPPPVDENVRQFLAVMNDPRNHPVLIHCFGGVHRTGAYCAIYRMEFEGWSNSRAMNEMKACGYTTLDDEWDICNYLEQYRPGQRLKITFVPK
jgi:tyrosine-protein phosphatase SIW14